CLIVQSSRRARIAHRKTQANRPTSARSYGFAHTGSGFTMTMGRAGRWLAGAAAVLALLVVIIAFFPWNVLRGPIAGFASRHLHREVTIAGDLKVHLGFPTRVEVYDVTLGNAPW